MSSLKSVLRRYLIKALKAGKLAPISQNIEQEDRLRRKLTVAERSLDDQFERRFRDYIFDVVIPRATKVKQNNFEKAVYEKVFRTRFEEFNGMTGFQNFVLELDCISRINQMMKYDGKFKHFPILVDFSVDFLAITYSNNGTSLNHLDKKISVHNPDEQILFILSTLKRARVLHLDIDSTEKNIVVDEDGTLCLIDFYMAQANNVSFNHVVDRKIKEERALTKERILKILLSNKNIIALAPSAD